MPVEPGSCGRVAKIRAGGVAGAVCGFSLNESGASRDSEMAGAVCGFGRAAPLWAAGRLQKRLVAAGLDLRARVAGQDPLVWDKLTLLINLPIPGRSPLNGILLEVPQ